MVATRFCCTMAGILTKILKNSAWFVQYGKKKKKDSYNCGRKKDSHDLFVKTKNGTHGLFFLWHKKLLVISVLLNLILKYSADIWVLHLC